MNSQRTRRHSAYFPLAFLILAGALAVVFWRNQHRTAPVPTNAVAAAPPVTKTNVPAFNVVATAGVPTSSASFKLRPFAVAKETMTHQWTTEDARDTNVIRRLAHNDLEYQRMAEENARIQRRQLVYRKDTAAAVMQRARASGETVKQLTLPGFDGQELQFTIDRADLAPSWQSGTFTGRLAGKLNSMVTVAFKFGRESFTVLSPDDGIYLQAWPREPGELIITSFDPDTYQPLPGGEPIRTSQK